MTNPNPEPKGTLVRYYLDGWRAGYLESDNGKVATVRPIGPKGQTRRGVRVPSENIIIEIQQNKP